MNYLEIRIKLTEDLIKLHKRNNKVFLGLLCTLIVIGAFETWADSMFGVGIMVMNTIWFIFVLLENWIEWRRELEKLKFYEQEDFKNNQEEILSAYKRSTENYKNLVNSFPSPMESK